MTQKKLFYALILTGILLTCGLSPSMILAQEEVTSSIMRYKQFEESTGYYEAYEVKPQHRKPFVEIPGVRKGIFAYSPAAASVRNPSRLSDSHAGIKFYASRRCEECHPKRTKGIHTVRANLTCRQCHGGELLSKKGGHRK